MTKGVLSDMIQYIKEYLYRGMEWNIIRTLQRALKDSMENIITSVSTDENNHDKICSKVTHLKKIAEAELYLTKSNKR